MFTEKAKQNKGFTLIETLIAILIFSVSIVALITITSTGSADGNFVKEKQTAYLLSQEGVEMVRYVRDSVMRAGADWAGSSGSFLDIVSDCVDPAGCDIDTQELAANSGSPVPIISCANPELCRFYYDDMSGFYGHSILLQNSGVYTDFIRTIRIEPLSGGTEEARIISTVEFEYGGRDFQVQLEEVITSWVSPPVTTP
jgi:prepilin-type N-terminal cleavage/methylation domain-containing protein